MFPIDYRIWIFLLSTLNLIKANNITSFDGKEPNDTIVLNWRLKNNIPVIDVNIGTPPQIFLLWLIIDSPYLWVFDKDCKRSESGVQVNPTHYYDANLSTTASLQNLSFNSAEDGVGKLYTDIVGISGLQFKQIFASVYKDIKRWGADGVLGLGYNQLPNSLFYQLTNTSQNKLIIIKINNDTNLMADENKGSLIIDPTISNNTKVSYVKSIGGSNWRFGINCAWVGVIRNRKFQETNDIGTIWVESAYTKGPRTVIDLVYRAVSAVPFGQNQYYVFKSKVWKIPPIHFELVNGFKFSMNAEDMLFEDNETLSYQLTGQREVRIFSLKTGFTQEDNNDPSWYFGNHFIKRYPILLDGNKPQKIGFIGLNNGMSCTILSFPLIFGLIVNFLFK